MNALLCDSPARKRLLDTFPNESLEARKVSSFVSKPVEPLDDYSCDSLHERAVAMTTLLEEILHSPPPSHWGINE